jgi:thiamine-phosphate pyrophosphorylase
VNRKLLRVLDANFNRSREGLRVCEDILRFVADDPRGAAALRRIRHGVTRVLRSFPLEALLEARDAERDGGKAFHPAERHRRGWKDLYVANAERAKEALRVLEETAKLDDAAKARRLKHLRFRLYAREKSDFGKL